MPESMNGGVLYVAFAFVVYKVKNLEILILLAVPTGIVVMLEKRLEEADIISSALTTLISNSVMKD
uniref:Uncharacterized protein n=1 Tax=Glossina pallidipes TaxID=7398 RepID=A0A1A9ZEJ1_GLOPL